MSYRDRPAGSLQLFIFLFVLLTSLHTFSAVKYTPDSGDPLLEPWRWQTYANLSGKGFWEIYEGPDRSLYFKVANGCYFYDGKEWLYFDFKALKIGDELHGILFPKNSPPLAVGKIGVSRFEDGIWVPYLQYGFEITNHVYRNPIIDPQNRLWINFDAGFVLVDLNNDKKYLLITGLYFEIAREWYTDYEIVHLPDQIFNMGELGDYTGLIAYNHRVCFVEPNSPADSAGVLVGDEIIEVQGQPAFRGLGPLRQIPPDPLEVVLKRKRETFTVNLRNHYSTKLDASSGGTNMLVDREKRLWILMAGRNMIVLFDLKKNRFEDPAAWKVFDSSYGLIFSHNTYFIEHSNSDIWISTGDEGVGIQVYDDQNWHKIHPSEVLGGDDAHNSILQTRDGAVWLGGFGKVCCLKEGEWKVYKSPESPIPSGEISLFSTSDGSLWICSRNGDVTRLDYETGRWKSYNRLNFQCESFDGTQWFISVQGDIIKKTGSQWIRYQGRDGVIDAPLALYTTRNGDVWAIGSHNGGSAFCYYENGIWRRKVFPRHDWSFDYRAFYEASDGKIYIGAAANFTAGEHTSGFLQYDPEKGPPLNNNAWKNFNQSVGQFHGISYGFGETADGRIWTGAYQGVQVFDGISAEPYQTDMFGYKRRVDIFRTTPENHLWLAVRGFGALYFDGQTWIHHTVEDGLANNTISDILITSDSTVWAVTYKGISRFDGREWSTQTLPLEFAFDRESGTIRESADGTVWISQNARDWYRRVLNETEATRENFPYFRTIGYRVDRLPPETQINVSLKKIPLPGTTIIKWEGYDRWETTARPSLEYSYALNDEPWTQFAKVKDKLYLELATGAYTFKVRARDADLNVDPTPAKIAFKVLPPVYRQGWFQGMMLAFLSAIVFLVSRIRKRNRKIKDSNVMLEDQARELESTYPAMNRAVQQLEVSINRISDMTAGVSDGSGQIAVSSQSLAQGAHEQAATLTQISTSLQEITVTTGNTLNNTKNAKGLSRSASESSHTGMDTMKMLSNAIRNIKDSALKTRAIVGAINDLAEKTNLLALNAAIEAARTGDTSLGFEVVAEEIGHLAAQSSEAVKNTEKLLKEADSNATEGVTYNQKMLANLDENIRIVNDIEEMMSKINSAAEQGNVGIAQINTSIEEVNKVVQSNSAMAEEYAAASSQIQQHAEALKNEVVRFRKTLNALVAANRSTEAELVSANTFSSHPTHEHQ